MEKETSGVRINAPDGQAVRLRFSRIFSIGVRTIISEPLRLITTLLMAVIVCSLSGFSVIAGMGRTKSHANCARCPNAAMI